MKILLNKNTGERKVAYDGFSVWVLLFSWWVPLFRGDVKYFLYMTAWLLLSIGLEQFSNFFLFTWGILHVYWAFNYNDIHYESLRKKGFYEDKDQSMFSNNLGVSYFLDKPVQSSGFNKFGSSIVGGKPLAATTQVNNEVEIFPKESKILSDDSYKLYLTDKYKITRNDVFQKYVYDKKMYDDLTDLLKLLHEIEVKFDEDLRLKEMKVKAVAEVSSEEKRRFFEQNSELVRCISSKGYPVTLMGNFPSLRWEVTLKNGQTKRISNLDELARFSESI